MKYEIDLTIEQGYNIGNLECLVYLELEISKFWEDFEIEDFTVNKVYVYDDSTGSERMLKTAKETNQFTMSYTHEIQAALDKDKTLARQVEDYLNDMQDEAALNRALDNQESRLEYEQEQFYSNGDY